jgi:two-component system, NarL family, nitrate/nitrite response regulator NarL
MSLIRIVIADDHPIFRNGLRRLLESEPGMKVVDEASDAPQAVELARQHLPDVLLLDLLMPNGGGLAALQALVREPIPTRVVLLTAAIDRREQLTAVKLGVRGIVTKETATSVLIDCIRTVVAGELWMDRDAVHDMVAALQLHPARRRPGTDLTARELDIVAAIVDGASNREIANRCGLREQTVKNHLQRIFDKVGVSTRLELASYAVRHKLLANRFEPP